MPKTEGTEIIELEKGVYARLHDGLTNAGIIIGDDSVMVIDSLRVPSFARDLISDIKYISDKPIKFVIDTHAHWDHAWGNEEFPEATIIGHQNCYKEMIDLEWNKQWRLKNKERKKEYDKKWYQKNKESSIKQTLEWRKNNTERYEESAKKRLNSERGFFSKMWNDMKQKERSNSFRDFDDFYSHWLEQKKI